MKRILSVFLLLALVLGLCACGNSGGSVNSPSNPAGQSTAQLRVGYSKVNITPDEPVPMGGYGNTDKRISEGFTDYLWVTCTAITDASDNTVILFGMDLVNAREAVMDSARNSIASKLGVPVSNIFCSASHTHSAPDLASDLPVMSRYITKLNGWMVQAAEEAMADRAPAEMWVNSVETTGLNFVRRYVLENGVVAGYQSDISDSGLAVTGHESEADHVLQMVKFTREGKNDVIMANFQTHPHRGGSATNKLMTADIVGAFRTHLEEELGASVIYFTGASGNINPTSQIQDENITSSFQEQGQALAQYVINANDSYTKVSTGNVQVSVVTFEGTIDHSQDNLVAIAKEVQAIWRNTNSIDACREFGLPYGIHSPYHANAICTKATMGTTDGFDIWAFSIGDVAFAAAPYEMFDTNGVYIKENSPFEMTFVITCTNGANGYFPSLIACENGGYEPDTTKYVHGTAEQLASLYTEALAELYKTK